MQSFLKHVWQRRYAALSLGGLLTASSLLAQSTVPELPPTTSPAPVAQPPITPPATPQTPAPKPTIDNLRPGLRDAIQQNRATREANRDNRQEAREENRENRELNRDTRANSVEPSGRVEDRLERREDRRERLRERLGFVLNAVTNGLAIANVQPNSVFGTAGLRNDDVILRVGDRRFTSNAAFYDWLATVQPGQPIAIVVQRGGRETTINWTPTEQWTTGYNADYQQHVSANQGTLGITLDDRQPQAAIVAEVAPGSLADRAGIRPRDQIVSFNGEKISNAKEFQNWSARVEANSPIDLGYTRVVSLHSAAKPILDITVPTPDHRNPPAVLPLPVTPRTPQPNPPRIDPSQANPGVTPPVPR